jgi:hypothetical protein|tara:strand:+ start:4197 stop:5045 length:849 start_codon:yes stop_codon:yes gene_type:complete
MGKAGTEVAAPANAAVAEFEGYEGETGFENQSQDDISIPFLNVLQSNSPQCEDRDSDMKPGDLFNTVTQGAANGVDGGVVFVPSLTEQKFVEWKPQEEGGGGGKGFIAVHDPSNPMVQKCIAEQDFGKYTSPGGNDLVETFYIYGVLVEGENLDQAGDPICIPIASTKIKHYKKWNTRLSMFTVRTKDGRKQRVPMFAHRARLTTVPDKNDKGSYYNISLVPALGEPTPNLVASLVGPDSEVFSSAQAFREVVLSGAAKVNHAADNSASSGPVGNDDPDDPF